MTKCLNDLISPGVHDKTNAYTELKTLKALLNLTPEEEAIFNNYRFASEADKRLYFRRLALLENINQGFFIK